MNIGLGLKGVEVSQAINAEGIHQEIVAGTSVRQSIVRNSVLPTIDGGVKVLKPIFGGVRKSTVKSEENINIVGSEFTSNQSGIGLSTTNNNVIMSTNVHPVIDLGTKVHKTIDLGVVNGENTGTFQTGSQIKEQNLGSNEIQLVSNEGNLIGNSSLIYNGSKINNQSPEFGGSGFIMKSGNEENIDNNIQGMNINTSSQFVTTGPTIITDKMGTVQYRTSSGQPIIGESNYLKPIVKTTVKQPIIAGETLDNKIDENNS